MFNTKIFMVILLIFLFFCMIQIYFYYQSYIKKQNKIKNIESFENTLININNNKDYILDDASLQKILNDYDNLNINN